MIHTEAAGVLFRSAAILGSAVFAIAVSSVASETAIMMAAMPRFSRAVIGVSRGAAAEAGWLALFCTVSNGSECRKRRFRCNVNYRQVATIRENAKVCWTRFNARLTDVWQVSPVQSTSTPFFPRCFANSAETQSRNTLTRCDN